MSKYRNCLVLICNVITVTATRVVKQTFFLKEKKSTAVEQKAAE
jgi:fumarate reductase subunit C